MDLELLGTTPEKILVQLERAARARYRYIHQCNAQDVKVDPAIDHQLTNHVQLLEAIAGLAKVAQDERDDAIRRGVAQARSEF